MSSNGRMRYCGKYRLAGQPVSDLAAYAAILRTLKAGEKVELRYRRDDAVVVAEVALVER